MLTTLRKAEYAELMILFFIQAMGMGGENNGRRGKLKDAAAG